KYHAILEHPRDSISLHNFRGGYCGIAPVENQQTCICYLTTAENLHANGNNIVRMEREVLSRNPFLKECFSNAAFVRREPLVIAQISFARRERVLQHALLLGDAAGLIAPLCGNGMSMALQSSEFAVKCMQDFLDGKTDR